MDNIQETLVNNMIALRKQHGLTQSELGKMISYSDKTVSKWENKDSCPNIEAICSIAKFYGVTVDDLVNTEFDSSSSGHSSRDDILLTRKRKYSKIVIAMLSVIAVWTVATIAFIYTNLLHKPMVWLAFIDAFPCSLIVLLVFNTLWGSRKLNYIILSLLLWTTLTTIYLHLLSYNLWVLYLLGIPIQIAIILWSRLKTPN